MGRKQMKCAVRFRNYNEAKFFLQVVCDNFKGPGWVRVSVQRCMAIRRVV